MTSINACIQLTLTFLLIYSCNMVRTQSRPKDNGDIYVQHKTQSVMAGITADQTDIPKAAQTYGSNIFNVEEVMRTCNASFSIPMDYIVQFNTTGELSDTTDKTGMCFIRCFLEKSGLIKNWHLNKDLIMQTMWSIIADSVELCESESESEVNACVRTYAIAKCLMKRTLEAAGNQTLT
ncbi:PREDICTED: general odorant-binding protein 84a [Rhagoletis zephyria]|uniref:general odorant-binding protein 84a n=1 Tax=Rhagoletis zephyria TaxID=28612 RepID=UPI0008112CC4|nr:PREDICTED: general odorant-binding protein 84a [Rhagoletis zephyria]